MYEALVSHVGLNRSRHTHPVPGYAHRVRGAVALKLPNTLDSRFLARARHGLGVTPARGTHAQAARPTPTQNFHHVDIAYNLNFYTGIPTRHTASFETPG